MNSDISSNIDYIKAQQNAKRTVAHKEAKQVSSSIENKKGMEESMAFLGSLGCAQVNMNNLPQNKSVRTSVETFLKDSDFVQSHVEICDELVKKGYPLEIAIKKTDDIFKILQDKKTYNS